jgi:four helix bundle protein
MTSEELKQRTKAFAIKILVLTNEINRTNANRIIINQVGRSATGMAANYRAALKSRSYKEFISKLGIVVEEADESWFWLDLLCDINNHSNELATLKNEAHELTAIFTRTLITCRTKASRSENPKS